MFKLTHKSKKIDQISLDLKIRIRYVMTTIFYNVEKNKIILELLVNVFFLILLHIKIIIS